MSIVLSQICILQTKALTEGAGRGAHQPRSAATVRILDDKATIAVGAPAVTSAEYIRFGKLPAGAVIYAHLSLISSNHTAIVAGKLQMVPLDGSTVQEITGVVVNLEATESTCIPDVAETVTVAKDSWIQFVPTADLTIASTAKDFRARIVYGQTY